MNLAREPLELLSESRGKVAFYGGTHNIGRSRHLLNKPRTTPTSEGMKLTNFGRPHGGRKIRYRKNFTLGEKLTHKKAPPGISRRSYRRRRFEDVCLERTPLLLNNFVPT